MKRIPPGYFGPGGSGLIRQLTLESLVNVSMGTLEQGVGRIRGICGVFHAARELLINRSRSFIYTTAPPPAVIGAALGALDVLEARPGMGAQLLENAAFFRKQLQVQGSTRCRRRARLFRSRWVTRPGRWRCPAG